MGIRITTIIENSPGKNHLLGNEHGLSFFIEVDTQVKRKILFDTGQSGKFIRNAKLLNLPLKAVDQVVISHGHYDHSGGFKDLVLAQGTEFELVVGQGFFTPKYADDNGEWRFLGNDFDQEFLAEKSIKTTIVTADVTQLFPGAYLMTNFPRVTSFEKSSKRFYTFDGTTYDQDLFTDEVVLVLQATAGLIVVLGCSHPGVVNILQAVVHRMGQPLHSIIGGTHLVEADETRLNKTLSYLRELDFSSLGISHCTGDYAQSRLAEIHKQIIVNVTGTVMEFT